MSGSTTIDPVFALRRFLERLPRSVTSAPILLACSGGPDSVALLIAAAQLSMETAYLFVAANINHKLRGARSDADARFVERLAKRFQMKSVVRTAAVSKAASGNLEERARDQRYAALTTIAGRRNCLLVLTAHTQDDQAETVFMNFLRGAGGDGLAGMPPLRELSGKVQLGRPFLALGRAELHRWLRRSKVRPKIDRTNDDDGFLRNWLRRRIFPQFEQRSPGFKQRLANSAVVFEDEKSFWAEFLGRIDQRVCRPSVEGRLLDLGGLLSYSAAVQRRFLRRVIGENILTLDAVERLRCWMMAPPTGGRTFQLRQGRTVTRLSKSQGAPSATLFLINKRMKSTHEEF